jgi:hypothetical protein
MAQAQLVNCIANVVPRPDLLCSRGAETKPSSGEASCSAQRHHLNSFLKSSRYSTSKASTSAGKKRNCLVIRCSSTGLKLSEAENRRTELKPSDSDANQRSFVGCGVEFKLSDFELCSHVSVGLAGKVSPHPETGHFLAGIQDWLGIIVQILSTFLDTNWMELETEKAIGFSED